MTPTTSDSRFRHRSLARRIVDRPEVGAAIGLAVVWIFFAIFGGRSGFLTTQGITSYLAVSTQVGIVATTVTLLLIAGEFDLSIGSMVAFSGAIIAHDNIHPPQRQCAGSLRFNEAEQLGKLAILSRLGANTSDHFTIKSGFS